MKNKLFLLLLFLTTYSFAQIKGNSSHTISRQNISDSKMGNALVYGNQQSFRSQNLVPNPIISLDVKALCNVVASSYTAVFNVTQIGNSSEETNALMTERIKKLKNGLLSKGILESDIVIDVISFVPVYETVVAHKLFSKKYNEIPKGFELQQNIHIKFTNVNLFENILTTCANNEIYNLVKVDYFIKDIQTVYKKLRVEILKVLKEKQDFYKALGFDLTTYTPTIADTKYCYLPKDFYKNYQAFNSISFEVLKKQKSVVSAKKQTSYYYNPISYENYDIVINEAILEPVVQLGMEIKLQYSPKIKKPKPLEKEVIKNKYFIISPEGNIHIKEIKINS